MDLICTVIRGDWGFVVLKGLTLNAVARRTRRRSLLQSKVPRVLKDYRKDYRKAWRSQGRSDLLRIQGYQSKYPEFSRDELLINY